MRYRAALAVAGVLLAGAIAVPAVHADGTEALGAPGITVANPTDAVFAGVGTQQHPGTAATLNVSVPAGASVKQVLAYWSGQDTWPGHGPDEYDDTITLNGTGVTGTLIGGPSTPYLRERFYTVRADVTALGLVSAGSNLITVAGMDFQTEIFGPTGNKGVGLVVIYDDGSRSTVAGLRDGQDYAWTGFPEPYTTTVDQTFTFAPGASARQGTLGIMAAEVLDHDLSDAWGNVVSGQFDTGQTFSLVNQLMSADGLEFDARNFPVTVPAGATSLTVRVLSQGGEQVQPAALLWLAAALTVHDPRESCPQGYWKANTGSWPPTGYSPSQKLSTVFSPAALGALGTSTMMQALSAAARRSRPRRRSCSAPAPRRCSTPRIRS
jgi:hypothetical protein